MSTISQPTGESTVFLVKSGSFEGPLELLLSLVEDRKLFINEVSLSQVTDEYLSYVKKLSEMQISDATGFILIASTLILIKSKSLLPGLELSEEEESNIIDLEMRLKLYQTVKEVMPWVKGNYGNKIIHFGRAKLLDTPIWTPHPSITVPNISHICAELFSALPNEEVLPEVSVRKVISIEEMISNLTDRIEKGLKINFSSISGGVEHKDEKEKKVYVIVGFLAMLELIKRGVLDVIQRGNFEEMEITKEINQ